MRRALFLCAIFLVTFASPFIATSQAAASEDVLVCCDAAPVELYLIGSDSNKRLTPFVAELAEEPQSVSVETSISSQETIGRWLLPNTWGGDVPSSTWTFSMNYEVANAAGVQINATATVSVGSKSFSATTDKLFVFSIHLYNDRNGWMLVFLFLLVEHVQLRVHKLNIEGLFGVDHCLQHLDAIRTTCCHIHFIIFHFNLSIIV